MMKRKYLSPKLSSRRSNTDPSSRRASRALQGKIPTPPEPPTIVGINLPKTPLQETTNDLTPTPALLTKFQTQVSHSH